MTKNRLYILSKYVDPIFITPKQFSHWFGYYNNSPIDKENRRILAHRVNFDGRKITIEDKAEVGWFDLKDGTWNSFGITPTFNWQQGAMLQWLGPDFASKAIYNDVADRQFISRITTQDGSSSRSIPWPIYGVIPNGDIAISLQFERSYWCRAYSYETIQNSKWNVRVAEKDGVFSVDLNSGQVIRIIDINTIINYDKDTFFDTAKHWLEHIMLNPSGTRFAFYHRYSTKNGFWTRVFTANINGNKLFLVPEWKHDMYTHLGWRNDSEFVLFTSKRTTSGKVYDKITKTRKLGSLIRKYYHRFIRPNINKKIINPITRKNGYALYKDGKINIVDHYNTGIISNDGHPSFSADGQYMLTDTYADSDGYRHLILLNTQNKRLLELGRFYSPFNECVYRSDLHPRFNFDESMIVIDSAHSGKHQMMVMRLNWDKINEYLKQAS